MSLEPGSFVIPLPPGMTPSEFQFLLSNQLSISIITAVSFAVILWDFICLLPDELKLYRSENVWNTVAPYAFVVLRYSGLLATLPALFFTAIPSQHCQLAASVSQVGAVLVTASAGIIFAARVVAIWRQNRLILSIVGFLYVLLIAAWITVSTQYRAVEGPPGLLFSNCQMQPIPSWTNISYTLSVVFDVIILALTLIKLPASLSSQSKIGFIVYRDALFYFFFTAATNVMVLTIQALPDDSGLQIQLLKPMVIPFSTIITVTLGSRTFLNLKLFNKRQNGHSPSLSDSFFSSSRTSNVHAGGILSNSSKVPPLPQTNALPLRPYHGHSARQPSMDVHVQKTSYVV